MDRSLETAQRILQEILKGIRELTEKAIRALIGEDPEAAVFLILEQSPLLKKGLAAQQTRKISTLSGMVPPYEKSANKKKDKERGENKAILELGGRKT